MNKILLGALGIFIALLIGLVAMKAEVHAGMPDTQCHQMANEKDKALENSLELSSQGLGFNPCTQKLDTYSYYRGDNNGITNLRMLFGNGDARGYLGLTHYWVCQDGRAKVYQRIYGPIWAWTAWGFWFNFPFDDDPTTWVKDKEICNTM